GEEALVLDAVPQAADIEVDLEDFGQPDGHRYHHEPFGGLARREIEADAADDGHAEFRVVVERNDRRLGLEREAGAPFAAGARAFDLSADLDRLAEGNDAGRGHHAGKIVITGEGREGLDLAIS